MSLEFTQPIRCYDGVYDSTSQRTIDAQEAVLKMIQRVHPEAHVTRFPVEECWQVHIWGQPLSDFHSTKGAALGEALRRIS